jgi:hypothetical protein
MKPKNAFHLIAGVLLIVILFIALPSCATTRAKNIDTQKRGLMLQDKSEFGTNKKHYKGSAGHKSQKKRMSKSGHRR